MRRYQVRRSGKNRILKMLAVLVCFAAAGLYLLEAGRSEKAFAANRPSVAVSKLEEWQEEGYYTRISVSLDNQGEKELVDWKLSLAVPADAVMIDGWDGVFIKEEDQKVLEIQPEGYNRVLKPRENAIITFVLKTEEAFEPKKIIYGKRKIDFTYECCLDSKREENKKG